MQINMFKIVSRIYSINTISFYLAGIYKAPNNIWVNITIYIKSNFTPVLDIKPQTREFIL